MTETVATKECYTCKKTKPIFQNLKQGPLPNIHLVIVCNVIENTENFTNRPHQLRQNHHDVRYAILLTGYQTIMDTYYRMGMGTSSRSCSGYQEI
jgi:hypothetical protein